MKRIGEALHAMLPAFEAMGSERLLLPDALHRHLAADVLARNDAPSFDNSAMDGYALNSEKASPDREYEVIAESRAGGVPPPPLAHDAAMRIFTGAPMPEGADAVVMQENVASEGNRIRLKVPVAARENVRA